VFSFAFVIIPPHLDCACKFRFGVDTRCLALVKDILSLHFLTCFPIIAHRVLEIKDSEVGILEDSKMTANWTINN